MAEDEKTRTDEAREANVKSDYYDEVDESAYEQSRKNVSVPDPRSRDLWQSTNISTDDNGPTVDQVAPVFAQARADALANPASDDGGTNEGVKAETADAAEAAQAEADAIRESQGYVAPTGADAGIYDDPKLEGDIPSENFSAEPERDEEERDSKQVAEEEKAETAGAQNVSTDEVDQRAPEQAENDGEGEGQQADDTNAESAGNTESNESDSTDEAPKRGRRPSKKNEGSDSVHGTFKVEDNS